MNSYKYGEKGEKKFELLVPGAKKTSGKTGDYIYKNLRVEIGRSKQVTKKRFKVYWRKLYYNILKEFHEELFKLEKEKCLEFIRNNKEDQRLFHVGHKEFIFVYFTDSLKKCAVFTYEDVLFSDLKKGFKGEPYFDMKVSHLYDALDISQLIEDNVKEDIISETNTKIDWGEVVLV